MPDSFSIAQEVRHLVTLDDEQVLVRGDDTSALDVFVYARRQQLIVSDSIETTLNRLEAMGSPAQVAKRSVSFMLQDGLVPLPSTIFEDVYLLRVGDVLRIPRGDAPMQPRQEVRWNYFNALSRSDSIPDDLRLLDLLVASVSRSLQGTASSWLMLSSGKDSVAIAAALAEMGTRSTRCLTYSSGDSHDEAEQAAKICRQLGLAHSVVTLPTDKAQVRTALQTFFRNSALPCGDFAQIPYALCLWTAADAGGAVLDGSMNDIYMGVVPSRSYRLKYHLACGGNRWIRWAGTRLPFWHAAAIVTRHKAQTNWPRGLLSARSCSEFYPDGEDVRAWWGAQWPAVAGHDLFDRENYFGRHYQLACVERKAKEAARALGMVVRFPWLEPALVDYYFNLPEAGRFNRRGSKSKVLLRSMLQRLIGYDADEVGKRFFQFPVVEFLLDHRAFVEEEIYGCSLWTPEIQRLLPRLYDTMNNSPRAGWGILPLFQLSGWYNHSRFRR